MVPLLSMPQSVLRQVVSHLTVGTDSFGRPGLCDAPALAALSTTCRLLSEHALDELWSHFPSLVPLLLAMPTDLVECKTMDDFGDTSYVIVRASFLQAYVSS